MPSTTGIPSLPDTSSYDRAVTDFLTEALREGRAFLKEEAGFDEIDRYIRYLHQGDLMDNRPQDIAFYQINRAAKAVTENAAALSDTKPLWGWLSANPQLEPQASIFNKLVKAWWLSQSIDMRLNDCTTWALTAGLAYANFEWNPRLSDGFGNMELRAFDPRDIIPIRPVGREDVQACLGVILRSVTSVNHARRLWPAKADKIKASYEGSFWRQRLRRMGQASQSAIDRLTAAQSTADMNVPMVEIYCMQLHDESANETMADIVMGDPQTNWSYTVRPGEPLYPRGRWIWATSSTVLDDGPNPYWHSQFTVSKLVLDPWPWSWCGKSALKDVIPLNDMVNEIASGIVQVARKNLAPTVIADSNAIPANVLKNIDSRKANLKLSTRPVAGDGVKIADPIQVPSFMMDLIKFGVEQIDDLSGTRGLDDLMALKQLPSADTVEKLQMSASPLIKRRGRQLEAFLRNISTQTLFNIMQYYTAPRRFAMLGPDGLSLEDFDYEPGTVVPLVNPGDPRSPWERAREHSRNFSFYVVPDSLLNVAQTERRMMAMALRRQGDMDHTTLLETLGVANIATINERLSSEIDQKIAAAAQMSPAEGRPPTSQVPPHLEAKAGRPPAIAES